MNVDIETIPWRGYRFVANVKELHSEEFGKTVESIAVLPFVNGATDQKTEYLAEGITEALITSLAQSTNLRVISRNSVFRYKGREVHPRSVGRELKIQVSLLGRVLQLDSVLSISVELIDTDDDRHVWGAQYIRNPSDLFATYETIVSKVCEKLRLKLPSDAQPKSLHQTANQQAYVSYLKGRYYFNKLTPDGVNKSIEHLQQAIEQDPNYGLAYTSLADCHTYFVPARSVIGCVFVQKGLCEEAVSEYRKVLELIQGSPTAEVSVKALMAHAFGRCGKRRDAIKLLEEVFSAGTAAPYSIAGIYAALGDCDAAFEWLTKAYDQRDLQLVSLKVDPTLNGLRQDRRFHDLVKRIGLPQ